MAKLETKLAELLAQTAVVYGNKFEVTPETVKVWAMVIGPCNSKKLEESFLYHFRTQNWPPMPSDILATLPRPRELRSANMTRLISEMNLPEPRFKSLPAPLKANEEKTDALLKIAGVKK